MPKPNYSFEKRRRELAKKKKQEEKDAGKREARASATLAEEPDEDATPPGQAPTASAPRVHLRKTPDTAG